MNASANAQTASFGDKLDEWWTREKEQLHQEMMKLRAWTRANNPAPGLFNPVSFPLLMIMGTGIIWGAWLLFHTDPVGLIPFVIGVAMTKGFDWPEKADPSRVWLITVFGKMTDIRVSGLTLLFNWIPKAKKQIVGRVEFELKQVDVDIQLKKKVRCADGKYIEGFISASPIIDDLDDPAEYRDKYGEWKSGGEKLRDHANTGGIAEIVKQLDDIVTTWVQCQANYWSSEDMERYSHSIGKELLEYVTGTRGHPNEVGNSDIDDTRGFGIRFTKFQPVFTAPGEVVTARIDIQVQESKRLAETVNTVTMNKQIAERMKMYAEGIKDDDGNVIVPPTPQAEWPTLAEVRNMILQENLEHDGKLSQVINQGGINVVKVN